jgi:hypothetical protein
MPTCAIVVDVEDLEQEREKAGPSLVLKILNVSRDPLRLSQGAGSVQEMFTYVERVSLCHR